MQSLGEGLALQVSQLDGRPERAFAAARNNALFEQAVRQTWADSPNAAEFVLAHVNSLFLAKDETPRKGAALEKPRYVMGVYLDDPMARSELNARREVLMLHLMRLGLSFGELRIIPSTLGMRERRLYPASFERMEQLLGTAPAPSEPEWRPHFLSDAQIEGACAQVEDAALAAALASAMRAWAAPSPGAGAPLAQDASGEGPRPAAETQRAAVVRRALCLACESLEEAEALLEGVARIGLFPCAGRDANAPSRFFAYRCVLFGDGPKLRERLLAPRREAVMARARELGLRLHSITCRAL